MTRRELILANMAGLVEEFLWYGRGSDDELPRGEIQAAVAAGEISYAEIGDAFRAELERTGELFIPQQS